MSTLAIRRAFEKQLALMSPSIQTAYENTDFTPTTGTPYQQVFLLPAMPDNSTQGASFYIEQGLVQITLRYPSNKGAQEAQARAEAVKLHFKRNTSMVESGLTVQVISTPTISTAFIDEDRYCIPISIYYQCCINL
jgi:hypothetical protein